MRFLNKPANLASLTMLWTLPALAAYLYAAGQLELKKALGHGATTARVTGNSNAALILWTFPLAFVLPGHWHSVGFIAALLSGAFLFTGRIFMVKALDVGDLSLVAPILATKTVMVGLLSWFTNAVAITPSLLGAAALASAGMAVLSRGPVGKTKVRWKAIALSALASLLFALSDVVTQGYAKLLGAGWFLPTMFATVLVLFPFLGRQAPTPLQAKAPLLRGSAIMGFQTSLVILLIGLTGQATLINVIYSTRSIWSVLVEFWAGQGDAREFIAWRMSGALLLTAGVVIALWK